MGRVPLENLLSSQSNVDKLVVFNILSMNIFLWLHVNAFFAPRDVF